MRRTRKKKGTGYFFVRFSWRLVSRPDALGEQWEMAGFERLEIPANGSSMALQILLDRIHQLLER